MILGRKGAEAKDVVGILDSSRGAIDGIHLIPNNEIALAKLNIPTYRDP